MFIHKIIQISIFLLFSLIGSSQVDFMYDEQWAEAREASIETGKPIFIDFYTTWCGPCKKMDKSTFVDSTVSNMMNEHFINVKLDAEKEMNKDVVTHYKINAYPTALFIDQNGTLISKEVGYKTADEFASICQNILSYIKDDLYSEITPEYVKQLDDEELDQITSKYVHFNFEAKEFIKNRYYEQLREGDSISLNAVHYLFSNFEWGDDYYLLIKMIPAQIPLLDEFRWKSKFASLFDDLFSQATDRGDLKAFHDISKYYLISQNKLYSSKIVQNINDPNKFIRTKKLDFYLKNKIYDEYYNLADSLINEYILPYDVARVKKEDEFTYNMMNYLSESMDEESNEILSSMDSLQHKHSSSMKMISRLNEISENVFIHLAQKDKLSKALTWMNRSMEYMDLPESRIIRAAILKELGRDHESDIDLDIAKKSPYYDEECKVKLKKLIQ